MSECGCTEAVPCVAGPSGITVRELAKQTGTDIKSWTEPGTAPDGKDLGNIRVFFIQASAGGETSLVLQPFSWTFALSEHCAKHCRLNTGVLRCSVSSW